MKQFLQFIRILICVVCSFFLCNTLTAEQGRKIRIGWYKTGNDEISEKSSGAHGYEYEYLQVLSQYTGWTYEYVEGSWSDCIEWLDDGTIDMLGFLSKTPEREKLFSYPSLPMAVTNTWLAVSCDSNYSIAEPETINGMTVGLVKNNAFNAAFEKYCAVNNCSVSYITYENFSDIPSALKAGEIDSAVVSDEDMTPSEKGLLRITSNDQYYAVSKKNQKLFSALDDAMLKVHAYCPYLNNDLYKKFLSISMNGQPAFTAAELAFIKRNPVISVLIDDGWPPIEFFDEVDGVHKGIIPDLLDMIAERSGLRFLYEGGHGNEQLDEIRQEKRKNILTSISYDYGWAELHNVYITQPIVSSRIVKIGKKLDSQNPVIAIDSNDYISYSVRQEIENISTIDFPTRIERLEAVRTGKADYTFVTEDQAAYYRSMPRYSNLQVEQLIDREQKVCICISKNSDAELMSIISKSLASVSHDEITTILRSNTVNSYEWTVGDFLYTYRTPFVAIVIMAALLIVSLAVLALYRQKSAHKLKKAYEQEKAALVMAEQASVAKGSFMSRMSHEIRTPLNAVIGYNTIARNELANARSDAERHHAEMKVMDCLTKSDIASMHLLTIINDVLDMSAIESGKIKVVHERFDFRGLITSLTAIFYSQAHEKGVDFKVLFDTMTEEWFVGDQMRISQILTNLLSNAVKFTPEGGTVTLKICQPEAEVNAAHIHFEISDTGIGMTSEYLTHIWTPFEQADSSISRRFGGTGLGLSITKNLVDLMGGTISVESSPNEWTVFKVDLSFKRTEQPQHAASYNFGTVNALVVDDDSSTCDYIKLLFNRFGARCSAVTSGKAALEAVNKAEQERNGYTVCLVDWRMPGMDGIETIRGIRSIAGDGLPIIVITAYDFSEIADQASAMGVNMFISKPLFQSSLFDLLANICGMRSARPIEQEVAYNFDGAHVLLVEDNEMNMEVAQTILESAGLVVDNAHNGEEAVAMFGTAPVGTYKAILMDVQMPIMDGHTATRLIRASSHPEAADIPIIAMTADAFAENEVESREAGMNAHISKPIELTVLIDTLRKFI